RFRGRPEIIQAEIVAGNPREQFRFGYWPVASGVSLRAVLEWLDAFPGRSPERIKGRKTAAVRKTKLSDVAAARQIHHLEETIAKCVRFPALPPGLRTKMISFCHGELTPLSQEIDCINFPGRFSRKS